MSLNLAEEFGSMSKACKIIDFPRHAFCINKLPRKKWGDEALLDKSRKVLFWVTHSKYFFFVSEEIATIFDAKRQNWNFILPSC